MFSQHSSQDKRKQKNQDTQARFQQNLASQDGESALKYLKGRGITGDVISSFGIGWCGLNDENVYLRGRLTVPLRNIYGEVLAFAGRIPTYKDEKKNVYSMHTGELVQYVEEATDEKTGEIKEKTIKNKLIWWHEPLAKRNFLYGLDQTWEEINKKNSVVIVEGEFDLYACWQAGIKNIVALLGSAFTLYQMRLLLTFCDNIVMLLDADDGGKSGWERSLEMYNRSKKPAYSYFNLDRIQLPQTYDPAKFIYDNGSEEIVKAYRQVSESYKERVPF